MYIRMSRSLMRRLEVDKPGLLISKFGFYQPDGNAVPSRLLFFFFYVYSELSLNHLQTLRLALDCRTIV